MELFEALKSRRSIRKYLDKSIDREVLDELLDLARRAPSSMNGQPCIFHVIQSSSAKRRLSEIKDTFCPPEKADYPAEFLRGAAAVVLVCVDQTRSHERDVENATLAAAYLTLAAWAKGIGTGFMTAYQHESQLSVEISKMLNLSTGITPIIILPMGYPDETPPEKFLRPLREIITYELENVTNKP